MEQEMASSPWQAGRWHGMKFIFEMRERVSEISHDKPPEEVSGREHECPRHISVTQWSEVAVGAEDEVSSPWWNSREVARAGFGLRVRREEEAGAGHLRRRATKLSGQILPPKGPG
jgi:hypothetical protein